MNFELLENTRYISDGNKNTIVVPDSKKNIILNDYNKSVITY